MSNYYFFQAKGSARISLTIIPCLFFFTNSILAQTTTSYNANSIPVTAGFSTAFGWGALSHNNSSIGSDNTATGYRALFSNTDGGANTATGDQALYLNTTGVNNTATGAAALYSNTFGGYNTAYGVSALHSNTSGTENTASGFEALYSNTTGINNTAHGDYALFYNTTGGSNTATGYYALILTTGSKNTALGDSAGYSSLGSSNVFIGYGAGANETGSNKMYIGNDAAKTLLYGDFSSGQVLLGKPNATGYVFKGTRTLNVLGGILADSVRIALSGTWADNVFNKDYKLKSLKELEQYISINKHLPDIPTDNEVKNNGINVADMQTSLLKKIEELTLYVIELKKESEQQQEEINKLKNQMK